MSKRYVNQIEYVCERCGDTERIDQAGEDQDEHWPVAWSEVQIRVVSPMEALGPREILVLCGICTDSCRGLLKLAVNS